MTKQTKLRVVLLSLFVLATGTVLASKALSHNRVDNPANWELPEFVDHLTLKGIHVRVVPSRADGLWVDNVYLTLDPSANWLSFQTKNQNPECIHQWRDGVWLRQIGPETEVDLWLHRWQGYGVRIHRFLVFGDPTLVQRIQNACQS